MSTEALTPEILRGGEVSQRRFDPKSATPFVNKSVSEETRRAYGRALREFFQSARMKHPTEVAPADVVLWRDKLRSQKKSAATVAVGWSGYFGELLRQLGLEERVLAPVPGVIGTVEHRPHFEDRLRRVD